jgi:protein-S-isoprenylcysteine O-methyltransferase Ste14
MQGEPMKIGKYQKMFGVGPIGFIVNVVLLSLLGLLGKKLGHAEISGNPGSVRILGIIVIVLWACWHLQCLAALKAWLYGGKLCTSGPYRLVRHPLYAGVIFFLNPGIALVFNSWVMLLCIFFIFPVFTLLVRREETMMTSLFGEEYRLYAKRTGRLFPRIL